MKRRRYFHRCGDFRAAARMASIWEMLLADHKVISYAHDELNMGNVVRVVGVVGAQRRGHGWGVELEIE